MASKDAKTSPNAATGQLAVDNMTSVGLMTLGVCTMVLGLQHLLLGVESLTLLPVIMLGGFLMLVDGFTILRSAGGLLAAAITVFGIFFASVSILELFNKAWNMEHDPIPLAILFGCWAGLAILFAAGSVRLPKAILVVFVLLAFAFTLSTVAVVIGYPDLSGSSLICPGIASLYVGSAQMLNTIWEQRILPLGEAVVPDAKEKDHKPRQQESGEDGLIELSITAECTEMSIIAECNA
ncbi:DUF4203 domain-containing protein [Plasmodiophora brassicae]|uniref:Uncharacterized protein n=1 Tax=Plasmodiophora brassicae TaxID=37360 RepID=A0A0G4IKV6_PLABS|nr:hypothetical protein PBRA_004438 [Plasmodiophora brassicae]SPQ99977.1 unnamed protein product [Plasmodiophora brassicae]